MQATAGIKKTLSHHGSLKRINAGWAGLLYILGLIQGFSLVNCSICCISLSTFIEAASVLFSEVLVLTSESETFRPRDFVLMSAYQLSG